MITKFGSLWAGNVDMDNLGLFNSAAGQLLVGKPTVVSGRRY